ncbi:MAG: hypothetical protein CTY31_13745 [Hyphomicrobium sp.]|nr:MAG: hypothetical protein CTY39_08585 [Hyphomicrobium sp.]PPC98336.1 MAG: hypothetical protein CTY31_13745 [Hyphomicrobium sp.]
MNDSFTVSEDTPLIGDVTPGTPSQDSDVDGDSLTVVDADGDLLNGITPVVGPTNGTLVLNANGTFTYTPNANFHGSDSFTYRITDGNGTFSNATVSLTILPVNDAPVAANSSLTTIEDQAFIGVLPVATDVDGDSLTYALGATAPQHGNVVINSDGTYTYVPDANYSGVDSFTYFVNDGKATVERTVTVLVTPFNDVPTINTIPTPVSADSTSVNFDVSKFVVNVDGDSIDYTATGLPPGLSIHPTTGVVTGTLSNDASQGGPYVVTLTIDDGQGGVATSSFTWQVNNPAPIARNDAIAIERGVSVVVPVLANDVDPDGDTLSVISASAQTGTVEVLADGSIRYTPRSDFNGRDTVTYRIADGNGGFAQATVTISVGSDLYVEQDQIFGFNGPESVANTDVLQSSPYETVSADGAVLDAVFNIGSLNSLAEQLSSDGAVISAANSVASLGGIGSLGTSGIVIDTIRIERAREIAFNAGFERSYLDPRLEGLPGFSLRHNVPGNLDGLSAREQVVIESLVRDQTLIVQISNTIEDGVLRITEYRITQVDGSALPDWLDQIGPDLLMGRHEVGSDDVELRIEAIYSDGTSVVENVRIDAGTGEISPLIAPVKDAAAPQMFGDQFRAQHMLTPEQIQGLGQAIAP